MKLRKIKNSNEGVVGIIVAVLLIGLLVTCLSIIQSFYVPAWMEEKESEHLDEVLNQFSQLKSSIDIQLALRQEESPMTTPITLGSKELPFFMSMPSYGHLDIIDDSITVDFYDAGSSSLISAPYQLGVIKFSSINAYYHDESYVYELGGVLTSESFGDAFYIDPSFKLDTTTGFKISFKLIDIQSVGNKIVSQSSTDSTSIQIEYSSNTSEEIVDVKTITIGTNYPNAWELLLEPILETTGLADVDGSSSPVVITFADGNLPVINLENYVIETQIGPGIVEN